MDTSMAKPDEQVEKELPPLVPATETSEEMAQDVPLNSEDLNNELSESEEKTASPTIEVSSKKTEQPEILNPFMVYQVANVLRLMLNYQKQQKLP